MKKGGSFPGSNVRASMAQVGGEYVEALKLLWRGRSSEALDLAAEALAEDPDHPQMAMLYRLWIAVLSDDRDHEAMGVLAEHLRGRSAEDLVDGVVFAALRGVIHFELDEFGAAKLMSKAVSGEKNPYCLELRQLVAQRSADDTHLPLSAATESLDDHFHLESLARAFLASRDLQRMNRVLDCLAKRFPESPSPYLFRYHLSVEVGDFDAALGEVAMLCARYPHHAEFNFLRAYGRLMAGDSLEARTTIEELIAHAGSEDPDLAVMLGSCYAELSRRQHQPELQQAGIQQLESAIRLLGKNGLPFDHAAGQLARLKEEAAALDDVASVSGEEEKPSRIWLSRLSPRRYFEMATGELSEVEHLTRPMGDQPQPGDLCFFAGEDANDRIKGRKNGRWRIVAIYRVMTKPCWHPVHGRTTGLQLVDRPPSPIPVDVKIMDEDAATPRADLGKYHPYRFGILDLEGGAVEVIAEAFAQYKEGRYGAADADAAISLLRSS